MNALDPVIKISDQISEAILLHEDVGKNEAMMRVQELFEMVGLDPSRVNNYPHEFSGGMRQRAMIAMALACSPKLVIADEPTTALDVIVQAQILKLIKDLQKDLDLSLLLITHDLKIISEICEKVAIMYAGKMVEKGSTLDVYSRPQHPYTRLLLAGVPSIKEERRKLTSISGAPPDLSNPPPGCRFYPRCPYQKEVCSRDEPDMTDFENRQVLCHFAGEIDE
jgi:peptide/nickel transport system ATP-binding protein